MSSKCIALRHKDGEVGIVKAAAKAGVTNPGFPWNSTLAERFLGDLYYCFCLVLFVFTVVVFIV
jgi:hypothetical protein